MKKQCLLLSLVFLLNFKLYAQTSAFNEFNRLFKSGQYSQAISALEKIDSKDNLLGEKSYWMGLSYAKLQEYDKAITQFEMAIKEKSDKPDLQYEYGQALYAANEMKAARRAFEESANKKFNTPASLYYVAHISQILEEFPQAKDSYTSLIKNKEADDKIKQIARFQLAETLLMVIKEKFQDKNKDQEKQEKNVEKYVIPLMKQAYKTDKSTNVATEIDQRIHEIEKEFNLDPDLLVNGRRISPKRYSGYLSQKIKFDDNISLTNEQNNVQQSKKESFIFESEADAKYDLVLKKRFIISPEARVNFIQHSDQDSSDVYQNDALSIYTNLKNKFEHTFNSQPASLILDLGYSKYYKDWKKIHKRSSYADDQSFSLGEMFNYFRLGESSLKFKRKSYNGVDKLISNKTTSISGDQTMSLPTGHILLTLFEADFIDNFNNSSTNTNTYLLRFDYLIPEIMPKYTIDLALAATITDTLDQNPARGTELSLNPSIDLSKQISEKMKIAVNYDFTKNKSKQSDYSYQKHVFSTEFRYSF